MRLNKKFLLLILAALAFNVECATFGAHTFGREDLKEGSPLRVASTPSALEQLRAVVNIPPARMAAWGMHVHLVIAEVFGSENYSLELMNLVSAACCLTERRTKSFFESDLEENQGRVRKQLAPMLLEKNGDLPEQAKILMWMVGMHPEKQSESVES